MILTPNGEMKIFADGVQVFHFLDGRWRLTDAQRKYDLWKEAIRDTELAERLFTTALNLAEDRRGGLLVVLDDPEMAASLVSRSQAQKTNFITCCTRSASWMSRVPCWRLWPGSTEESFWILNPTCSPSGPSYDTRT